MKPQKFFLSVFLVAFFIFLFQAIAWLARIFRGESFVCNTGGPFGIAVNPAIWYVVVIGSLLFFIVAWQKTKEISLLSPWICIVAAGGSNLIERLSYGCVADYLKFSFFPTFNLADIVLSVSVVFLLWRELREKE